MEAYSNSQNVFSSRPANDWMEKTSLFDRIDYGTTLSEVEEGSVEQEYETENNILPSNRIKNAQ